MLLFKIKVAEGCKQTVMNCVWSGMKPVVVDYVWSELCKLIVVHGVSVILEPYFYCIHMFDMHMKCVSM